MVARDMGPCPNANDGLITVAKGVKFQIEFKDLPGQVTPTESILYGREVYIGTTCM